MLLCGFECFSDLPFFLRSNKNLNIKISYDICDKIGKSWKINTILGLCEMTSISINVFYYIEFLIINLDWSFVYDD